MATTPATTSTEQAAVPPARTFTTLHKADFVIATDEEARGWIQQARLSAEARGGFNMERFLMMKLLYPIESADLRVEPFADIGRILSRLERIKLGEFLRQVESQEHT